MIRFKLRGVGYRPWRLLAAACALVVGLFAGFFGGAPTSPATVDAACAPGYAGCGADTTASSSLIVTHAYEDPNTHVVYDVEPNTTDTIDITAKWFSGTADVSCYCQQLSSAQATVTVSWSDASQSWTAICTSGCDATNGPIKGVSVCTDDSCGGIPPSHSWQYELVVDIEHTLGPVTCGGGNKYPALAEVDYSVTDADDGYIINACSHGSTMAADLSSPIGATDYGTFECGSSCIQVAGPSVRIDYQ
jgi:hypothetical protein